MAMKDFTKVMKALRDPNRVKIVKMLQHGELCVCEIQAALGVSQPTVSKHVKILEAAGLVSSRKDGLWVHYSLHDGSASPYAATMLGSLKHWLEGTPAITEIVKRLPAIRRENLCKTCE
jgi:ArsR family transcriptional regulator, arsenate/arsenite/antimonite-responsive transcriptional repressor